MNSFSNHLFNAYFVRHCAGVWKFKDEWDMVFTLKTVHSPGEEALGHDTAKVWSVLRPLMTCPSQCFSKCGHLGTA